MKPQFLNMGFEETRIDFLFKTIPIYSSFRYGKFCIEHICNFLSTNNFYELVLLFLNKQNFRVSFY